MAGELVCSRQYWTNFTPGHFARTIARQLIWVESLGYTGTRAPVSRCHTGTHGSAVDL